jgi:hypothetical protein
VYKTFCIKKRGFKHLRKLYKAQLRPRSIRRKGVKKPSIPLNPRTLALDTPAPTAVYFKYREGFKYVLKVYSAN